MITIRKSSDRGYFDHGWLKTHHTFSFGDYHDPQWMGFRTLRVINEDWVEPGMGFGTHPHRDMEIITYVLEGALEHKDSMGTGSVIVPGEVQRMSAGSGVTHSEFNHSPKERVHLLQIWILPEKKGIIPSYEQKTFSADKKENKLCLLASPDGRDGSLHIHQDAHVYATLLKKAATVELPLQENRHAWVQVVRGTIILNGHPLNAGDGAALSEESELKLTGVTDAEVLTFELGYGPTHW